MFIFFVDNHILQDRAISGMADIDYQMYSILNQIPAAIKDARWNTFLIFQTRITFYHWLMFLSLSTLRLVRR